MIRSRSASLLVATALACGGCAGGERSTAPGADRQRRTFEPHRILVRGDELLLLGVRAGATTDGGCGRGRDLVVLQVSSRGELEDVTEFPRNEFGDGDCVETIETAFLDRGALLVSGWALIAEPEYGGAGRYPYAARLRPGDGPDQDFGEGGFIALPHPTAGLAPFGGDFLYVGGVRFDRRGQVLDEFAFSYSGANGRIVGLPGGRAAVVLFNEATPNYHLRIVGPRKVGPTTSVVVGRSTSYAEVTQLAPVGRGLFVLMEDDTTNEVVHRHGGSGRLVRAFGRQGRVVALPGRGRHQVVTGIAATPTGGLVTTGELEERRRRKAFVTRFDSRGRRLGTSVFELGPAGENIYADATGAVAVQPDSKIVVAAGIPGRPARLSRLRANGQPDREFGDNGSVALTLP
jgi:hypothetical protein